VIRNKRTNPILLHHYTLHPTPRTGDVVVEEEKRMYSTRNKDHDDEQMIDVMAPPRPRYNAGTTTTLIGHKEIWRLLCRKVYVSPCHAYDDRWRWR
jgi:hypothetical protein